jgi:hypothetical protein
VRRIPAIVAALGLSALALTGCAGPSADASCERTSPDAAALDVVAVTGDADEAPTVTMGGPVHIDESVFVDEEVGSGIPVTSTDQVAVFGLSLTNASTGAPLGSLGYPADYSAVTPLSVWTDRLPGLTDALLCATEGTRTVAAVAREDITDETAGQLRLGEDDGVIAVVDLHKVYLPAADGDDRYNDARGLPTVVRAPDGRPGIIVPDAEAPDDLVVEVLKEGDGETVTGDAPVRVHYTGLTWDEQEVFDTTWDSTPQPISLDAVIPGFATALEGQTVGSQILVVIPPDLGYGDQEQGSIPADSTLVFVIDILGIDEPATGRPAQ